MLRVDTRRTLCLDVSAIRERPSVAGACPHVFQQREPIKVRAFLFVYKSLQ